MSKTTLTTISKQWQPYLSWFDATLQPILSELLSQLNLMLGSIEENNAANNDWHSGLGEIRSRGHYENLLLSEWLLFDDEPDEFLRRAVTQEHLFLTPTPEEQKSNNAIIALFDEGILQLGNCRLVHLVMMLLLADRAIKQHSQFYWGVIQHPAELHSFSGLDSLIDLLKKKSLSSVNQQAMDNWSKYLDGMVADERWFIGAKITAEVILPAEMMTQHMYISQQVTHNRKLNIITQGNGTTRSCELKLPSEIICTKLILGQLAPNSNYSDLEQYSLVPISIHTSPIVSMSGNNIAALTHEEKHVLICSLVDTLSAKQKCKINFSPFNGELIALDFQNKKMIGLIKHGSDVFVWQPNKKNKSIMIAPDQLDMANSEQTKFIWLYEGQGHCIYLIDKNQTLWQCYINRQPLANSAYELVEIDKKVISLFKLSDTRCVYSTYNENDELRLKSPQLRQINCLIPGSAKATTQILIADEKNWQNGYGIVAYGTEKVWQILTRHPFANDSITSQFTIPSEWTVWGLPYRNYQSLALLIHNDRKKIATFNPENHDIDEIYYSPDPIVQCYFSSLSETFALITENHELILYSFATDSVRLIIKNKDPSC